MKQKKFKLAPKTTFNFSKKLESVSNSSTDPTTTFFTVTFTHG